MKILEGKVAVVTGASRGIGRAIAVKLAAEGAHVLLTGRDQQALDSAVRSITEQQGIAESIALDLRQPEAAEALTAFAVKQLGVISILINNAGATQRGHFPDLSDEDWADSFAVKFFGAVRLSRAAWPFLKETHGSLVNIAGVGGRTPGAEFSMGGSVNAALLSLTKALADLGVTEGVQVNAVNPGPVRTARLTRRLEALATEQGIDVAAAETLFMEQQKIARIGEPEDIAALIAFIVSPAARLIHGSLIDIDGGQTKTL